MTIEKARAELEKACDELGKLFAEHARLVKEVKTFEGKDPKGTMAVIFKKLYNELLMTRKLLERAMAAHEKAIEGLGKEYEKHFDAK